MPAARSFQWAALEHCGQEATASKLRILPDPTWTPDPHQTDEFDNFAKGEVIWLSMLVGSLCSVRALKPPNW